MNSEFADDSINCGFYPRPKVRIPTDCTARVVARLFHLIHCRSTPWHILQRDVKPERGRLRWRPRLGGCNSPRGLASASRCCAASIRAKVRVQTPVGIPRRRLEDGWGWLVMNFPWHDHSSRGWGQKASRVRRFMRFLFFVFSNRWSQPLHHQGPTQESRDHGWGWGFVPGGAAHRTTIARRPSGGPLSPRIARLGSAH